MLQRLRRWLSGRRSLPTNPPVSKRAVADWWSQFEQQPLSLDAQLAIANGRMNEAAIREGIRARVRRFRESTADNPASLWAMSFVDPYSWAMDTPDFYPGAGLGASGYGVPWMLNRQPDGRGDLIPAYINEMGLKLIRDWSRKQCVFNEFAINAVSNRQSYLVGKGMQFSMVPKKARRDERGAHLAAMAQEVIDEFISRERFSFRQTECVLRGDRDGGAFLRFFHLGSGFASVRFIEPEFVTQQHGSGTEWSYGILTERNDVEKVLAYSVIYDESWNAEEVPASDILHIKCNSDSGSKRGLPLMFPVRKNLERADKLLRNMSVMAQVQATFAVIRKHQKFSPSSVSAFEGGQADIDVSVPASGRSLGIRQLVPGSIIDASANTEYEFPSANIDSAGLVEVLEADLRAISARLSFPPFMLTTKADNINVSTALVSESPFVKRSECEQAFWAHQFGDGEYGSADRAGALWRVLRIAVDGGRLPWAVLTDLEIQCEAPSLAVRNKQEETNRAKTLNESGILSDATWSKWEGLDHEQELRQGAKPKAPAAPPSDTPNLPGEKSPPGAEGQLGLGEPESMSERTA